MFYRERYFFTGGASSGREFAPSDLLFLRPGTVHALATFLRSQVVFLPFDTPRRDQKDVIFANPKDGTPEASSDEASYKICTFRVSSVARHACRWFCAGRL
jgi:hypothetical protein